MSDTFDDVTDDLGDEQVDLVDEAEDTADEVVEDLPFVDIDQFKDHVVVVKVDGADVKVPLAEAVAGYQRQADYTRKTQELAQQRAEMQWAAALKGALEHDPQSTLDLLAQQFGVRMSAPEAKSDVAEWWQGAEPEADPKYRDLEQRLTRFEEERAQQQLERTIRDLSDKYGDEFDPQEVVIAAVQTGSTDLEATFKQIKFDKVMAEARAAKAAAAKAAQRKQAKREAAVVSGGSSGGASSGENGPISSIADAWREAKRSLGA